MSVFADTPVYVINVDADQARWRKVSALLEEMGARRVTRVSAIVAEGWRGCAQSHAKALKMAHDTGDAHAIILEDDFSLAPGVTVSVAYQRVDQAFKAVGRGMDALYLAMTPARVEETETAGLVRVRQSLGGAGMLYPRASVPKWQKMVKDALERGEPHDMQVARNQGKYRLFGFFPPVFVQAPGFSRIEGKSVDYGYLEVGGAMLPDEWRRGEPRKRGVYGWAGVALAVFAVAVAAGVGLHLAMR